MTGMLCAFFLIAGCSSTSRTAEPNDQTPEPEEAVETEETQSDQSSNDASETQWRVVLDTDAALERIRDVAEEWYGVPYKWGGESQQGIDCSAFVQAVYKEAFHWLLPRVTEQQVRTGRKIRPSKLRPGDLVFFQPGNNSNHVGIYLEDNTFVHASSSDGVTRSSLDNNYWTRYYWVSRRLMTPSKVPDTLASQLVAYRKVQDSTGEKEQQASIVDEPIVDADSSQFLAEAPPPEPSSNSELDSLVASADTTQRRGW